MQFSEWEIIILKPTYVFSSFLASQLPDIELPDPHMLSVDNTAYVITKQKNDEETLNEIERHFKFMFHHEISRWLGDTVHNEIESSFLDFLCCFKFELHSHIVLMEESMSHGKQLMRVKPRSVLLKWMKSTVEEQRELTSIIEEVTVSHLAENATVIIKNFNDLSEVKPFLQVHYPQIFEAEMFRMCDEADQWPKIDSYETFSRYFSIDIHTQLIHLH
ncbi:Uncharacterised protein [Legionella beliardensis]|uniref:Uncharacterized protein n=1 Tax=Legionella beliardensis TaxID=91822 RepID=A0A378I8M6_9GAMM|nr:hypothetical protein [Legionella beliardensis]STX28724.1 Uncharacterised protein [Legionella beliardensis]